MELHWPLILFTTFIAWSAGLFGAQCVAALKGGAKRAQIPAWICSAVLLVVGGIAVFLHLHHWERIFNGFGNITSGITQELIAIVALGIVALVYLVMLRKNENSVPQWIAILGIVVSVLLVAVMAHSYVMAARPAWDSFLWVLYILGNACAFGGLSMSVLMALFPDENKDAAFVSLVSLVGSGINVLGSVAYGAFLMFFSTSSFTDVGMYFDTTHAMNAVTDVSALASEQALLVWGGAVVLGSIVPAVLAYFAKSKPAQAKIFGLLGVVLVFVGALCMRAAFYNMGVSVYMFY